jgi:hypothetical protein
MSYWFNQKAIHLVFIIITSVSFLRNSAVPSSKHIYVNNSFSAPYIFGVVNDTGQNFDDLWARGVRATTFEFQWKKYEPQEGVFDQAYIDHMKQLLIGLKTQGWYIQMIPGYHYTPDWVFANYPNMFFVDQYGESYNPDPITQGDYRVTNALFNPQARSLITSYLARIFQDFNQNDPLLRFDAVRVGGVVQGELRYPPSNWNGHTNAFWAFDAFAQDPNVSNIPAEVKGWRPGVDPNPGSVGRGQLIVNPGFELSNSYIPILGWSPDDEVTSRLVSTSVHAGSKALELSISTPHRIHQYVRVQPNTTYQFGGWLKSGSPAARARIIVTQYDNKTNLISGAPFAKLETLSTTWTTQTGSLTTSSSTTLLKVEMDGDQPGIFYFDDLWLKKVGDSDNRDRNIDIPVSFYDWYLKSLINYQNWQISEMRKYFQGSIDLVIAGKGLLYRQLNDALVNDLSGDGWSESNSALYSATMYDQLINNLISTENIRLYLTGIDEPSPSQVNDSSPYPSDWSAAAWTAYLAHKKGIPVWGENSGQDNLACLQLSAARMRENGFIGLMWVTSSELYAAPNPNGYATAADYESLISIYSNFHSVFLPITRR